ncbi:MAG: ribonuclease E/G [Lachnospiraceae bacterium]|nr:ribonuclease E/G [Lachnospiraceae bacterium]
MTENRAVFTKYEDRYVLMHIVGNKAEHIYVYPDLEGGCIGNVYNCVAEKRMENFGKCFVRYDRKNSGFINKDLKSGTILPLQYKKDGIDGKQPLFTDKISIEGEYVVATSGHVFVKTSRKASYDNGRIPESVIAFAKENNLGIILRTKACTETGCDKQVAEELEAIKGIFDDINSGASHSPAYTLLYSPLPEIIKDILYLIDQGVGEIVTDDEEIKETLSDEYPGITGPVNITDRVSLRFYDDKMLALSKLYSFEAKISEALSRKVYLKSGACITFDHTEALTAVDVNSASSKGADGSEESILSVNTEAAVEIARQLRLRNISGTIVIDFINMESDDSYKKLEEVIKDSIIKDRISTTLVDITKLKLAELTRKRTGNDLFTVLKREQNGR